VRNYEDLMSAKLIVGNLSLEILQEELEKAFSEFGSVSDVVIPADTKTGRNRGFAFVHMSTRKQAELAASRLDRTDIGGRQVTVSILEVQEKPLSLFDRCVKLLQA
jgi:RNA recognition motif-containing protein